MHTIPFKPKALLTFPVLLVVFLTSCTITKRHYRPGYHIEWHHRVTAQAPLHGQDIPKVHEGTATEAADEQGNDQQVILQPPAFSTATPAVQQQPGLLKPAMQQSEKHCAVQVKPHGKKHATGKRLLQKDEQDEQDPAYLIGMQKARRAQLMGVLSLVLFLVVPLFGIILSPFLAVSAVRAGLEARMINCSLKNTHLDNKASGGILMGQIAICINTFSVVLAAGFFVFLYLSAVWGSMTGLAIAVLFHPLVMVLAVLSLVLSVVMLRLFFKYVVKAFR